MIVDLPWWINLTTIESFELQVQSVLDFVTYDTIGNRRTVMHLVIIIAADKCQDYDRSY